jgi:plasmid replication initiation protein
MSLTIADLIAISSLFISLMVAGFNVYKIIKDSGKVDSDKRKTDKEIEKSVGADTAKVYAEAAKMAADQNIELRTRIDYLEKRVDELCDILKLKNDRILELEQLSQRQETRIKELENEVSILKNGNDRP